MTYARVRVLVVAKVALALYRRLVIRLGGQGKEPLRIITDKLKSCAASSRTILSGVTHDLNNMCQQSRRDFASAHYANPAATNACCRSSFRSFTSSTPTDSR